MRDHGLYDPFSPEDGLIGHIAFVVSRVSLHILYLGSTLRQLRALLLFLMLREFISLSIFLFYDLDRFTCISFVSRIMLYIWCFFHFCLFCAFKFYLSIICHFVTKNKEDHFLIDQTFDTLKMRKNIKNFGNF